jgi:KaiC/GvpD/RAD55 family RecA-like ATPase
MAERSDGPGGGKGRGDGDELLRWLSGDIDVDDGVKQRYGRLDFDALEVLNRRIGDLEARLRSISTKLATAMEKEPGDDVRVEDRLILVLDDLARTRREAHRLQKTSRDLKDQVKRLAQGMPPETMDVLRLETQISELKAELELKAEEAEELRRRREQPRTDAQEKKGLEADAESKRQLESAKATISALQAELDQMKASLALKDHEAKASRMAPAELDAAMRERFQELQARERKLLLMQSELERNADDVLHREEEVRRVREIVDQAEDSLVQREEDLKVLEQAILMESQKLREVRGSAGTVREIDLGERAEKLSLDVQKREEAVKLKEKTLELKAMELRLKEQGIVEDEIRHKVSERASELKGLRAHTGNARLDDLLMGGIPFGSNIMLYGPPFVGKEVLMGGFIAEGLRKGIPAIWVITDRTPGNIREEMESIVLGYREYEGKGLVRYIDSYSKNMEEPTEEEHTTYIEEPSDLDRIVQEVDEIAREFKDRGQEYRLAFRSLSTLIAYADINTAFRFLSPFCGRRKRDGAVAMYTAEKGMHSEQEVQMLGSMMDGMIDFKLEQQKNFFAVQGIADVQSRGYIRYTFTKGGLSIGSFALDHIR